MLKMIFAALLCTCTGIASAQSAVSTYGIVDVGVVREHGGVEGAITRVTSGIASGSRLGIRGRETLDGDLSALFLLENGFQADTGTAGQGGLLFGRQAYVGLQGRLGAITLGRQYTPQYLTVVLADPFSSGSAGDTKNLMAPTGNSAGRMDNSLKYVSPNVAGWSAELAYAAGEVAGNSAAGRQYGAALDYGAGPLRLRVGHHSRNNDTALVTGTAQGTNTVYAAVYDFGHVKAHVAYGVNRGPNSSLLRNTSNPYGAAKAPLPSTDSRDLLLGATMPFGAHTLLASYIRKKDRTVAQLSAEQYALGYQYALSKRTDLYTALAHIVNQHGAGYTVGSAIEGGNGNQAIDLGIRHAF
jgi:predicted porin